MNLEPAAVSLKASPRTPVAVIRRLLRQTPLDPAFFAHFRKLNFQCAEQSAKPLATCRYRPRHFWLGPANSRRRPRATRPLAGSEPESDWPRPADVLHLLASDNLLRNRYATR